MRKKRRKIRAVLLENRECRVCERARSIYSYIPVQYVYIVYIYIYTYMHVYVILNRFGTMLKFIAKFILIYFVSEI